VTGRTAPVVLLLLCALTWGASSGCRAQKSEEDAGACARVLSLCPMTKEECGRVLVDVAEVNPEHGTDLLGRCLAEPIGDCDQVTACVAAAMSRGNEPRGLGSAQPQRPAATAPPGRSSISRVRAE